MLLLCALLVGSASAWAETKTFDFKFETIGTEGWANSYAAHSYEYTEGTVKFTSASKQTGTITTMPVTKGQPVEFIMADGYTMSAVTFTCSQWGSKAQTITLHYSTDGGENYTSTDVTSTNFSITSGELPSGTNAVKITFNSTSNQVGIESASVTYSTGGGDTPTLEDNDLALTNAPIALTFDLYNNATAQTFSYTTSSTGEVSVESGQYDVSCYVDNTAKTITVTPMAVTNGVQTVTVKQAADANYKAGSVTFTVTVTDSTPVGDIAEETITFSELGYANADDITKVEGKAATLSFDKGSNASNAPKYYNTGTGARMYNGNTLTISSNSKTIESIEFTFDGSYTTLALSEGQPGTLSDAANGIRTWEGSAASIEFTTTATNRIQSIKITYADDTLLDPALAFSATEVEATFGQDFTAPTLSAAQGFDGTVEYSSSVETVAQVKDTETGELRIVGGGTTVITATFAGNDTYKKGSASYTLTVTDNRVATTITQENITIDIADIATLTQLKPVVKDANDRDVAYTNNPNGEGLPEVYFEVVGEDEDGILGSFDSHGNIILNSVVGTVTIKAVYNQFQGNSRYRPSECTFTITVVSTLDGIAALIEANPTEEVYLKLTDAQVYYVNGKNMYIGDGEAALCFYNTGLEYTAGQRLNGTLKVKYTVYKNLPEVTKVSENNLVVTDGEPTSVVMNVADVDASKASILVEVKGTIVVENSTMYVADEVGTTVKLYDNFKNGSLAELAEGDEVVVKGIVIVYNEDLEIAPISLSVSEGSINVEIASETGYATYVPTVDVSFNASGVTAYTAKVDGAYVTLTEVNEVPGGTPVILKAAAAGTYQFAKTSGVEAIEGNELLASDGTVVGDGNTIYALGYKNEQVGFYRMEDHETVPAGKAYLKVAAADPTQGVREFLAFAEGETDGIQTLSDSLLKGENIYSLSGQRVQKAQKGIYIVNGKKIMVK